MNLFELRAARGHFRTIPAAGFWGRHAFDQPDLAPPTHWVDFPAGVNFELPGADIKFRLVVLPAPAGLGAAGKRL